MKTLNLELTYQEVQWLNVFIGRLSNAAINSIIKDPENRYTDFQKKVIRKALGCGNPITDVPFSLYTRTNDLLYTIPESEFFETVINRMFLVVYKNSMGEFCVSMDRYKSVEHFNASNSGCLGISIILESGVDTPTPTPRIL